MLAIFADSDGIILKNLSGGLSVEISHAPPLVELLGILGALVQPCGHVDQNRVSILTDYFRQLHVRLSLW